MKRTVFCLLVILTLLLTFSVPAFAGNPRATTIQGGQIVDSAGNPISTGYDVYGYNYQAHLFNGYLENAARPAVPVTTSDTRLVMKWNDAWLSNQDMNGDHLLDRHYGYPSYIGSGAWLTNEMSGTYELNGETIHWTYFVKIVAVPADAVLSNGAWYAADGSEIGPSIWGQFAVIQEVSNDPGAGQHGLLDKSQVSPGFGFYKP